MNAGVFEKLTSFNRCMDDVVMILTALETTEGFDKSSMELFTHDAAQLKVGVNRYFGERLTAEADKEAVRLDALHPPKDEEEP